MDLLQTPRRPPGSLIFGSSISSTGPMSGGIPDKNNFNSGNLPQSSVVEQERKLNEIMNQVGSNYCHRNLLLIHKDHSDKGTHSADLLTFLEQQMSILSCCWIRLFLFRRCCSQLNGFERLGDRAVFNFDDIRNRILDEKP